MKKKLLAWLLCVSMITGLLPVAAFAEGETNYKVYVNNMTVTSANQDDVFKDGKVSYEPTTKTLTLRGYQGGNILSEQRQVCLIRWDRSATKL